MSNYVPGLLILLGVAATTLAAWFVWIPAGLFVGGLWMLVLGFGAERASNAKEPRQ